MALDDDIRILSGVGLFESFTQEQLRLLAFGTESTRLPAGRRLFREDDEADSAYVVVSGTIKLFRERDGEHTAVALVQSGSIIGELALIADTKRLTSAEASRDAELLRINRKTFHRILEEYPDLAVSLLHRITEDLQSFIASIEDLAPRFSS
ncbi:cyclic nucleotide-binding domain-containing protein [Mesorhizobium sp. SB112]|uniref:cyclic nucleotide-binding domain-containing protein n=1 Tax=Mesorhizobium sp. SB112 TaxID=3151853 RepID=UPI0032645E6E